MSVGSFVFNTLTVALLINLVSLPSWAGQVVKVQGKKIFIRLDASETESIKQGDRLFLTTTEGKKKALVLVRKKQNDKVIAQLLKGKGTKGLVTAATPTRSKKKTRPSDVESASDVALTESPSTKTDSALQFGIMGSYGQAAQNVSGVADMSGSTMGFKGILDYSLFETLGVRARVGLDMMSVTGAAGNTNFETNINYLALDLLLRWYLMNSESFGLYLNGGMGIYSPMSTDLGTNQAIREDSISTTSLLIFGLGFSIPMGSMKLFAGVDYLYFPPSEDVKTTVISGNLGLLFDF